MSKWNISNTISPDAYFQFICGAFQHPTTNYWQLWISFDAKNIHWVAAYQDEAHIQQIRKELNEQIPIGEKWNREKALTILDTFYAQTEFELQPMPRQIEEMIRLNYGWPGTSNL